VSTIDPDARARAVRSKLRPAAYVVLVIALLAGPVCSYIVHVSKTPDDAFEGVYLVWLFLVTGGGLFAYYTIRTISALSIAAYSVAALLYGLHLRRRYLQSGTTADGVNTNAEVRSVGVSGMYNNVQIFALTLKFVDQQGVTRFFRTHLTAVGGWNIGDKIPIRYNAEHPSWKSAIIVNP
jgi:hypothetical protein